jgi:hypothetical protein
MPKKKQITAREIIAEYLKAHGYDGLCTHDCGCGLDDFICCSDDFSDCVPAYKSTCSGRCDRCSLWCFVNCGDNKPIDIFTEKKPRGKKVPE